MEKSKKNPKCSSYLRVLPYDVCIIWTSYNILLSGYSMGFFSSSASSSSLVSFLNANQISLAKKWGVRVNRACGKKFRKAQRKKKIDKFDETKIDFRFFRS